MTGGLLATLLCLPATATTAVGCAQLSSGQQHRSRPGVDGERSAGSAHERRAHRPEPRGCVSRSEPGAVPWGAGHSAVFVRGGDDALYFMQFENGVASGWQNLDGVVTWNPTRSRPARVDGETAAEPGTSVPGCGFVLPRVPSKSDGSPFRRGFPSGGSSPDGQVSGMAGASSVAWQCLRVGGVPAIPSTSLRAITPRQGGHHLGIGAGSCRAPLTRCDRASPGRRDGRHAAGVRAFAQIVGGAARGMPGSAPIAPPARETGLAAGASATSTDRTLPGMGPPTSDSSGLEPRRSDTAVLVEGCLP